MAYEWVGPASTAVTGIAGVAFAWLTSKSNGKVQVNLKSEEIRNGRDAQMREEKREAYSAFLHQVSIFENVVGRNGFELTRMTVTYRAERRNDEDFTGLDDAVKE